MSEAELSWLWSGQRYPAEALVTADGQPVSVLIPGHRGGSAGPDFRDAVVVVEGERRCGDVELHVRASSFRAHGHHLDPAYARVVLEVVYRSDAGPYAELSDGGRAPVAALAPWVERRSADLRSWLAQPALWEEPCRDAGQRLGDGAVEAVLRAGGERRFNARRAALAGAVGAGEAEAVIWRELVEALGYGGDRAGFRRLGLALSPATLPPLIRGLGPAAALTAIESVLLEVAGLGREDSGRGGSLPSPLSPLSPPLGGVASRPANRPQRRLAGFARLLLRADCELACYALASVGGAKTAKALTAAWQVGAGRPGEVALIGGQRAVELLINVVLPFAAAVEPALQPAAEGFFSALPAAPAYGRTAFLENSLRRPDGGRRVSRALAQQGLLALHGEWCSQGGCGRCPLS